MPSSVMCSVAPIDVCSTTIVAEPNATGTNSTVGPTLPAGRAATSTARRPGSMRIGTPRRNAYRLGTPGRRDSVTLDVTMGSVMWRRDTT